MTVVGRDGTTPLVLAPGESVRGYFHVAFSDADGYFDVGVLPAGVYRLEETVAPDGFVLPASVWFMQLTYNEQGEPQVAAKAIGDQPYAQPVSARTTGNEEPTTWGEVWLTNMPQISPPLTGGKVWWMFVAGLVALMGAASVTVSGGGWRRVAAYAGISAPGRSRSRAAQHVSASHRKGR